MRISAHVEKAKQRRGLICKANVQGQRLPLCCRAETVHQRHASAYWLVQKLRVADSSAISMSA